MDDGVESGAPPEQCGCYSIHSDAVRGLIQLEGGKIDAAQTNIDVFQKETEERIKNLEQARSFLHESFGQLQMLEASSSSCSVVPQNRQQERGSGVRGLVFGRATLFG